MAAAAVASAMLTAEAAVSSIESGSMSSLRAASTNDASGARLSMAMAALTLDLLEAAALTLDLLEAAALTLA